MKQLGRLLDFVTDHSRITIAVMLVLTLAVGSGVTMMRGPAETNLAENTVEQQKLHYIQEHYDTGSENTTTLQVYVRPEDGNVLSKKSLLRSLRYQREVRSNDTFADALVDGRPTMGVSNLVATRLAGTRDATLDQQISALDSANASTVNATVGAVLAPGSDALALLPSSYEPGTTRATGRRIVFSFDASGDEAAAGDRIATAKQVAYDELQQHDGAYFMLDGPAVQDVNEKIVNDSLQIVGPFALLFVLIALALAYRDLVDVVVGAVGIVLTLVWMFGLIGWLEVPFGQAGIIAPILIIGLSIDYALHVFMRYREHRGTDEADDPGLRRSMRVAIGSVGAALALVTVTTAIGFLSNLTNSLATIRSLSVATSIGVVAALAVFLTLVPALKVEIDALLEGYGFDRRKQAFGVGGGVVNRFLSVGANAARVAPVLVILAALIVGSAGVYGGTQLDTETTNTVGEPAQWKQDLPEPIGVGEYRFIRNMNYVQDSYRVTGANYNPSQLLVEGDVTQDGTLEWVASAGETATESDVAYRQGDGTVPYTGPVTVMQSVAERDAAFRQTFQNADTDGDGVPDRNLKAVYDALYAVAPQQAASVVERTDGEYRSLRFVVPTSQRADPSTVATTMRDAATEAETASADTLTVTATGNDLIWDVKSQQIIDNLLQTLLVSLAAIAALLAVVSRLTSGSASRGLVTTVPIVLVLTFVAGSMWALDVPLTMFTTLMSSLAIGLGIDYSIHVSERFAEELERCGNAFTAVERAVTGTGGALLGSTMTTAGAFGTMSLAIIPQLRQLGIMVGLALVYSFVASVFVLPSLLVLWSRWLGPDVDESATVRDADTSESLD